jgi:hypothetical protein
VAATLPSPPVRLVVPAGPKFSANGATAPTVRDSTVSVPTPVRLDLKLVSAALDKGIVLSLVGVPWASTPEKTVWAWA